VAQPKRYHPQYSRRHDFREPIICKNVPRIVAHWNRPVVIARHGFGDQYRATEVKFDGAGTITLSFRPKAAAP